MLKQFKWYHYAECSIVEEQFRGHYIQSRRRDLETNIIVVQGGCRGRRGRGLRQRNCSQDHDITGRPGGPAVTFQSLLHWHSGQRKVLTGEREGGPSIIIQTINRILCSHPTLFYFSTFLSLYWISSVTITPLLSVELVDISLDNESRGAWLGRPCPGSSWVELDLTNSPRRLLWPSLPSQCQDDIISPVMEDINPPSTENSMNSIA